MATPLFPQGVQGLSDSKHSGTAGSVADMVGLDVHSDPGVIKVHQKLKKIPGVDEFFSTVSTFPNGERLWFCADKPIIYSEKDGIFDKISDLSIAGSVSFAGRRSIVPMATFKSSDPSSGSAGGGMLLNSSGGKIKVIKSATQIGNSSGTTVTLDIEVPANLNDAILIVQGGTANGSATSSEVSFDVNSTTVEDFPPIYGTIGGSGTSGSGDSFTFSQRGGYILAPTAGTNTVTMTFTASRSNMFLHTTLLENVNQATPITGLASAVRPIVFVTGFGFNFYAEPTEANQMFISFILTPGVLTQTQDFVQEVSSCYLNNDISTYVHFMEPKEIGFLSSMYIDSPLRLSGDFNVDGFMVAFSSTRISEIKQDYVNGDVTVGFVDPPQGNGVYFPVAEQNLEYYFADGNRVYKIQSSTASFDMTIVETDLFVKKPEKITALHPFDIDLLIGTYNPFKNYSRVLRWDTESESWFAEDDVMEDGINAFISDDNYTYIQAGSFGKLYFYNGEQMIPFKKIPGDYSPTKKMTINQNSVTTLLGVPRFGVSNVTGNPVKQGVYTFGSYSKDYPKVLDLSFPVPTKEMTGVEIGVVFADGADLYVSYKSATESGIGKLDYNEKYDSAYIETRQLTPLETRSDFSKINKVYADYVEMPTDCDVDFSVKKKYESTFAEFASLKDIERMQKRMEINQLKIASLQLRLDFTVNGNDAPVIENISYD